MAKQRWDLLDLLPKVADLGFSVQVFNRGIHCRALITKPQLQIDFWPTTGRWVFIGGKRTGSSEDFLVFLKGIEAKIKQLDGKVEFR